MKRSTDRILTTHVGSLPRPANVLDLLTRPPGGDEDGRAAAIREAVRAAVEEQVAAGIDIVGDGEMSKTSYTFYVAERLSGITRGGDVEDQAREKTTTPEAAEFHDFFSRRQGRRAWQLFRFPKCDGPLSYADTAPLEADLGNLADAVRRSQATEAFLTAASPGVLTKFVIDDFYRDEDAYLQALGEAMQVEYEAIAAAGFLLQIDCPDLGSARHSQYRHLSTNEFRGIAERNIAVLNYATRNIAPEVMRMHVCWGNYEGPHTSDLPLSDILDICLTARPQGFLFEGANPRHAHEWEDIAKASIPQDKVLIPGVIDSTTNFVEHPRLIAQRIMRYADIVGRERVIAGTDCGFGTFASGDYAVVPSVVLAKFKALAEGAAIATDRLWGSRNPMARR